VKPCGTVRCAARLLALGNDVKTWREIVETMESRHGRADRIWCGDREMMSRENIEFMESGGRPPARWSTKRSSWLVSACILRIN